VVLLRYFVTIFWAVMKDFILNHGPVRSALNSAREGIQVSVIGLLLRIKCQFQVVRSRDEWTARPVLKERMSSNTDSLTQYLLL